MRTVLRHQPHTTRGAWPSLSERRLRTFNGDYHAESCQPFYAPFRTPQKCQRHATYSIVHSSYRSTDGSFRREEGALICFKNVSHVQTERHPTPWIPRKWPNEAEAHGRNGRQEPQKGPSQLDAGVTSKAMASTITYYCNKALF